MEARWKEHVQHANDPRLSKKKYRFQFAIKKYGCEVWVHDILAEDMNLEDAYVFEEKMILEHGTLSPYGYNEIKGGRGVKMTAKQKIQHREATRNALSDPCVRSRYLEGIRRGHSTPEFLERNRKAQTIAQSRTDVVMKKRVSMLSRCSRSDYVSPRAKPVVQIDRETGNVIATYTSATQAAKLTGIFIVNLCEAARGKRKSAGGFAWCYQKTVDPNE